MAESAVLSDYGTESPDRRAIHLLVRGVEFDRVDSFLWWFNLLEAGWWLLLAGVVRLRWRREWLGGALALALVLFSISDLVELETGAWWSPWWLAVWKLGCGGWIALLSVRLWSVHKHRRGDHPRV